MSAQRRGWGPGWPTNRIADQIPLRWITGRVHKDIHDLMYLLCAETQRRGYSIRKDWSWGYANRAIGGGSTPSNHSWGLAIDINAPANPQRRPLTTDMPSWMPRLWKSYGFRWGGDYVNSAPDAMHYEFMGTPTDARVQTERARSAFGGTAPASQEDEQVEAFIRGLQAELNRAGHRDGDNRPLVVDGVWGARTQFAFRRALSAAGSEGPRGPRGPAGARGPAGPPGKTPTKVVISGDVVGVE